MNQTDFDDSQWLADLFTELLSRGPQKTLTQDTVIELADECKSWKEFDKRLNDRRSKDPRPELLEALNYIEERILFVRRELDDLQGNRVAAP